MSATRHLVAPERGCNYALEADVHIMDCPSCGIRYGIPEAFRQRRLEDGKDWYCPNGHTVHYPQGESEKEKLKRQLKQERTRSGRLAAERDQAVAKERGQRAAKTRFKNELKAERKLISEGTCPCCGERRFAGLKEHMAKEHPEYAAPEPEEA